MRIFGIYGGYLNHDPGVCLVEDGEIVFCWNEERPRRLKPSDIDDQQKMMSQNGFYVPSGLGISKKEIKYVSDIINKILN